MGVYNTCDVTKEEISRLMVGRDVILNVQKDKAQPTDVVLRVRRRRIRQRVAQEDAGQDLLRRAPG